MVGILSPLHFGVFKLAFLFLVLANTTFAQFNPSCGKSSDFPPRCKADTIDPISGATCTKYGYDCVWTVTDKTLASGVRRIEVNGAWPPPTVKVEVGQRIRIELVNRLTDPEDITLHFHGLLMENGYVLMDGPQHLTQGGVQQSKTFVYDFPTTKSGTYWIHSHAPGQYPKGLRSALIITDPKDITNYGYQNTEDEFDKVITLSDYWKDFWDTESKYLANKCGAGIEVAPENQMFNDEVAPATGSHSRQKVSMLPGKKYRLRFINIGAHSRYYVWIAGNLNMEVIEIDGVMLKTGHFSKGFEISSGQRVSVLVALPSGVDAARIMVISDRRINKGTDIDGCKLVPNDHSPMQYTWGWLVNANGVGSYTFAAPSKDEMTGYGRFVEVWDEGTYIEPFYKFRPKLPFTDQDRNTVDVSKHCGKDNKLWCICDHHDNCLWNPSYAWNFSDLAFQPWNDEAALTPIAWDSRYIHEITLNDIDGLGTMGLQFKSPAFIPPDQQVIDWPRSDWLPRLPTLLRALVDTNFNDRFGSAEYYGYDNTQTSQTIVMNEKDKVHWFAFRTVRGDHPVHMHGHEFQIIAKVPVRTEPTNGRVWTFAEASHDYSAIRYNTNPSRRDTIMVERGTTVIVAIKNNNPGVWALHCHNDFHAKTGMFMQLVEDIGALRDRVGRFVMKFDSNWEFAHWGWYLDMLDTLGTGTVRSGAWKVLYQTLRKTMESYGYPTSQLPFMCGNITALDLDEQPGQMNCEDRPDFRN